MTQNVDDALVRTRRSVLLAAAGGAAAATAVALGRPAQALAADDDPLLLGAENHAESLTGLHRDGITTPNQATFYATTTISAAIVGVASETGQGVIGRSVNSAGVQGYSETDAGVNGFGVYGVWASGGAYGLFGTTVEGDGVHGESDSGVGGSFVSNGGEALFTSGRLHFEKVSGVATIAAGNTSKVVTPGTDLSSASFVLLTPRSNLGGRDLWYTVDAGADTFRIRISKAMGGPLKVGWLLID
jgi:hypothetical protein